jgi:hypothetical protein
MSFSSHGVKNTYTMAKMDLLLKSSLSRAARSSLFMHGWMDGWMDGWME